MRSPLKKPAGEARVYVTVLRESVIHPGSPPSRSFSSPNETTPKQATMHRFPLFPVSGGGGEGVKKRPLWGKESSLWGFSRQRKYPRDDHLVRWYLSRVSER